DPGHVVAGKPVILDAVAAEPDEDYPHHPVPASGSDSTDQDRTMVLLIYLLGTFLSPIISVVIWAIKRKDSDFIDYHGKQFLNLWIMHMAVSLLLLLITAPLAIFVSWWLILPGMVVGVCFSLYLTVQSVIAAIKAKNGEWYVIPGLLRLVR